MFVDQHELVLNPPSKKFELSTATPTEKPDTIVLGFFIEQIKKVQRDEVD